MRIKGRDGDVIDDLHDYLDPSIARGPRFPSIDWGAVITTSGALLLLVGGVLASPAAAVAG